MIRPFSIRSLARRLLPLVVALMLLPAAAWAQETAADTPPDLAQRVELSRKLHEIRPATLQVEAALTQVAQRLPETERKAFIDRMMSAIDAKKLEEVSVNAMASVFTLPELQKMLDYFSTPEAHSISDKMPIYQNMLQPEIVKMLDKAMMEMRTGTASPAPAPAPASDAPAQAAPAAPAPSPAAASPDEETPVH